MGDQTQTQQPQQGYKNPTQPWLAPATAPAVPITEAQWAADEPFLSTSVPGVRITPFRDTEADALALTALLNHPSVGKYAFDRPFPYTLSDASAKIKSEMPSPESLAELRVPHSVVDISPFTAIRHDDRLVGCIRVWLRPDGRNVFGLTYDLHPDFQGRGIVSAAVRAVLGWAGRGMECGKVEAYAETSNVPSAGLLRKMGFSVVGTVTLPWPAISGGGERELFVFQRTLPTPAPPPKSLTPAPPTPEIAWDDGEPFIDIGDGLRLTPFRDTQAEVAGMMALCNAPVVSKWTYTRPYPFETTHARGILDKSLGAQAVAVKDLAAGPVSTVSALPFTVIRDREGRYVGDVALYTVPDDLGRRELSYAVHPDWHGRGVGGRAARAVLGFAVARMGVRRFQAYTQTANAASGSLLRRLGFEVSEVRGYRWPESKGGGWREVAVWVCDMDPAGTNGGETKPQN